MPIVQKIFALSVSIILLIIIIELVRRRKLREEYSVLWIITGITIIILSIWYKLLLFITKLIGAVVPTSTLFLFSLLFLILISLHFSVKISMLTDKLKEVSQEIALLRARMEEKWELSE
ncbi:MAG: DUF2304 domain-containing protein [Candidatus Schekmanbacteria bacterium]|nr:MAG: DUF2304 domain-containing protein [Candidatus Schekmanbacteria bacterium]